MIEERFNGETYYLKAKLSADPDEVVARINELGEATKLYQQEKSRLLQVYEMMQENKQITPLTGKKVNILYHSVKTKYVTELKQRLEGLGAIVTVLHIKNSTVGMFRDKVIYSKETDLEAAELMLSEVLKVYKYANKRIRKSGLKEFDLYLWLHR